MAKTNLLNLNRQGMREFFAEMGEKPFRADQVMKWIYQQGVSDFEQMSNLNKHLRAKLIEHCEIVAPEIAYQQNATDGTIKFALRLEGGQEVETVWIPEADRATLCVSSQVGCALECTFCSTAQQGFNRNLSVSEIIPLHTDESHSFVCCLSSLNLAKYNEWKNTNLVYDAVWFLDGVLEEFIQKAKNMRGFDNAVRSAEKGRALGLGVLGWHTLLQQNGIAFEGLLAQFKTREIFSKIKIESERASRKLAEVYGEPLWCVGTGMRNTHLRAVAPTVSNSKLSGNVSPGIEPWAANVFTEQSAKGTFIRKNNELKKVFRKVGIETKETWDKVLEDGGSIQGIKELDGWFYDHLGRLNQEEGEPVKNVFKTFKEINQLELVNQAGIRQDYIDQSVSLNLAFPSVADPKWINKVHLEAWKRGIKTLYYMRTESVLRGDIAAKAMDPDCISCDG